MKRIITFWFNLFLCVFLFAQDPGTLDMSFGVDGIANITWPGKNTDMYSMSIQSDGRMILAGNMEDQTTFDQDFLAVRLTPNGTVDNFGNQGDHFSEHITPTENLSTSCILPDDKIIMGGSFSVAGDPIIYQLHPDGEFDYSFSGDGSYTYVGHPVYILDITYFSTTDGHNILTGGLGESNIPELMMVDQDGNRVASFGTDGIYQIAGITGPILSLVIDESASVIYCLISDYSSEGAIFISKHDLHTGNLINTFGTSGILEILPFGDVHNFQPKSIILEPDMAKLTVIGHYYHIAADHDLFAVRLNASDGSIDPSFGLAGWSTLRIAGVNERVGVAIRQSDGMFYIGGYTNFINPLDFMVCRINNNGVLDTEFGDGGFTILDVNDGDFISGLALSPDESRLYCGGASYPPGYHHISVASLYTGFTSVGIPEKPVDGKVKLYPNPATSFIDIDLNDIKDVKMQISDLNGKIVLDRELKEHHIRVDISHLSNGTYILYLEKNGGKVKAEKFIKH